MRLVNSIVGAQAKPLRPAHPEVAKQFERVSKGKGNRHRVRNTFADFYREHFGIDLPFASVRTYCQNWLKARKAETSVATHSRYEKTIERFVESLGEAAETDLNEVTKSHVTSSRVPGRGRDATQTANFNLKIKKRFSRPGKGGGYLWKDPAEGEK